MLKRNLEKDRVIKYLLSIKYFEVEGSCVLKKGKCIGYLDKDGYLRHTFRYKNKFYNVFIHNIIWIHNKGLIPQYHLVNHINGDKSDNDMDNFELLSEGDNVRHAFATGLSNNNHFRGIKNVNAKLNEAKVLKARDLFYNKNWSKRAIAKRYGVSAPSIADAITGRTYSYLK